MFRRSWNGAANCRLSYRWGSDHRARDPRESNAAGRPTRMRRPCDRGRHVVLGLAVPSSGAGRPAPRSRKHLARAQSPAPPRDDQSGDLRELSDSGVDEGFGRGILRALLFRGRQDESARGNHISHGRCSKGLPRETAATPIERPGSSSNVPPPARRERLDRYPARPHGPLWFVGGSQLSSHLPRD